MRATLSLTIYLKLAKSSCILLVNAPIVLPSFLKKFILCNCFILSAGCSYANGLSVCEMFVDPPTVFTKDKLDPA